MSTIEIQDLDKSFRGRPILRRLTLSVAQGRSTAIIGASGCGKSTLLRCITGLEGFEAGRVKVGDASLDAVSSPDAKARALRAIRSRVGLVFQGLHLFPHRSAIENVSEAPVHVKKQPIGSARARASELLNLVGLSHRENAYPSEMSGGEQQRVAIARALAMDPDVLLLDEPTSALDPSRRRELTATLRSLGERGITIVVVTHEMAFARDVSDRTAVLGEGGLIEEGTSHEVFNSPRDPRTRSLLEAGFA